MKKIVSFFIQFLCLSTILFSCQTSKTSKADLPDGEGSEALYRQRWVLSQIEGKELAFARKPFILFTPGQVSTVSGNAGCNNYTGSFELSGKRNILFRPMAVTQMSCADGDNESIYLQAINKATEWRIINGELSLYDASQHQLLRYIADVTGDTNSKVAAGQASPDGTWELDYISGTRIAFEGLYPNKKPILKLDLAASEASGNTSCNQYSCTVSVKGSQISFGDAKTTRMFCEGGGETAYLEMLKKVNGFGVSDNNTLNLLIGDIAVMRFKRK